MRAAAQLIQNRRVIERASLRIQEDDGGQHQHRTGHRVQEELDRGVDAAVVAPDADQEVHRHQHDFPEHVEQEQIPGGENADQPEFQQQQKREELFDAVVDGVPRKQNRDRRQERGKNDQPQAQAIDADVIVNLRILDPDHVGDELLAGLARFETRSPGRAKPRTRAAKSPARTGG